MSFPGYLPLHPKCYNIAHPCSPAITRHENYQDFAWFRGFCLNFTLHWRKEYSHIFLMVVLPYNCIYPCLILRKFLQWLWLLPLLCRHNILPLNMLWTYFGCTAPITSGSCSCNLCKYHLVYLPQSSIAIFSFLYSSLLHVQCILICIDYDLLTVYIANHFHFLISSCCIIVDNSSIVYR